VSDSVSAVPKLSSALIFVNKIAVYVSSGVLTFIAFLIVADVSLRFILNAPIPASTEICKLLIPYIAFMAFAFTLSSGQHVRLTLLTGRLPVKLRAATEAFVYLFDFVFFALIFWFSGMEFWHSFEIGEMMSAAIKLPWWIGKFAMPVGTLLIAAQCILSFIDTLKQIKEK
jgi:TRAP-type C4-dicarboxylate transport system permease small subunit